MLLQDILREIETEFSTNWPGEVHFASSIKKPTVDEWLYVDVVPLMSNQLSYEGCSEDVLGLYVTCYALTKVTAYNLADRVTQFIANKRLNSAYISNSHPVDQNTISQERYYIKIMFYIKN